MKMIYCVLIPMILAFSFLEGNAQENIIKVNILSRLDQTLNLNFERKLGAKSSLQLGMFYTGYRNSEFQSFGITPEYRSYLSKSASPSGFYIAPFVRYHSYEYLNINAQNKTLRSSYLGGGVMAGKQWIFNKRMALDIFMGPSYSRTPQPITGDETSYTSGSLNGFGLRAGLSLGIGF